MIVLNEFEQQCEYFFNELGDHKFMVLSTALNDKVTSRTLSMVIQDGIIYFQTDKKFRKYEQIRNNPNVAVCVDNTQIEGICRELGHPLDFPEFCTLFQKCYEGSYKRYTALEDERLFEVRPIYMERWIYEQGEPMIEIFNMVDGIYRKNKYLG